MHKKDIGTMGESIIVTELLKNNCSVFTEFGDNSKVDLIAIDDNYKAHKIQVKAYNREKAKPNVTVLYFTKSGPNYKFKYTKEMIDWFAVIDLETMKIAWVPSNLCEGKNTISLRHTESRQSRNVSRFDDYASFPFN